MADEKLIFDLLAGQNTVLKELTEIRAASVKTEKSVGSIGSTVSGLAKPFAAAGAAAAGSIAALVAVGAAVFSVSKEAIEAEDATNRLNAALKANGNLTDGVSESLLEYASNVQRVTTVSDDVTVANLALLQSLAPLTKDGLIAANDAAIDLAAALRIDLDTAVRLVGKAANGNVDAFKKYGVEIKKGKTDAESFSNALDVLNKRFGGSAANEIRTFSGAAAQAGNALSDVVEEIGNIIIKTPEIIDIFRESAKTFTALAETIRENAPRSREAIGEVITSFNGLTVSIQNAFEAFRTSDFTRKITLAVDFTGADAETIDPFTGRVLEAQKATALWNTTIEENNALFSEIASSRDDAFNSIIDGTQLATKETKKFNAELLKSSGPDPEAIKKAEQAIKGLQDQVKNAGLSQFDIIAKEAKERTKLVKDNAKLAGLTGRETENLLQKVRLKNNEELSKAQTQANEKLRQETADNLKAFTDAIQLRPREAGQKGDASKVSDFDKLNVAGAVAIKSALNGAEGAVELVKTAIGFLSSGLSEIPVIGPIIGDIIDKLALAPAEFAKNIGEFFKALPNVISNILINSFTGLTTIIQQIPAFLMEAFARLPEVLVEMFIGSFVDLFISIVDIVANLPALIAERLPILIERFFQGILEAVQRLVAAMPQVARAFSNAMPGVAVQFAIELGKQAVPIALEFISALVKEAPRFITELIKAIPSAVGGIGGIAGGAGGLLGGLGGSLGGIGDVFGFAEGGIVPGGAPFTDRVPALLTPGEAVVDRTLVNRLEQFLTNPQQAQGGGGAMTVNLVIGEQQLANVILDLNRRGYRLA